MQNKRRKQLLKYVIPSILSSCCMFLFIIVDGVFVGRGIGADALGAINIVFPFVMTINALFMLTTIGGITVTAIRIGRGDIVGANKAFMHALTGTIIGSALLSILGTCFTGFMCRLLGASETYYKLTVDYLFWFSLFIIPQAMSVSLQGFCRNDGQPVLVTAAVIVSTAANIFSDWLFVFPLQMGLKGAAIATGISQSLGLFVVSSHYIKNKGALHIQKFRANAALFRKIVMRGLPEMISQFAIPITTLCMNYSLIARLGNAAMNSYSIINYVSAFFSAVFLGTAEGLQPLFGQSYGAKDLIGLRYYFTTGRVINLAGSSIIFTMLIFTGRPLCALFGVDSAVYTVTIAALPKYGLGFIFISLNTLYSAYFYSTKRTKEAVILNICRGLVFNSIIISALPAIFGNGIVWFTVGIAEALAFIAALILLKNSERNGIVFKPAV